MIGLQITGAPRGFLGPKIPGGKMIPAKIFYIPLFLMLAALGFRSAALNLKIGETGAKPLKFSFGISVFLQIVSIVLLIQDLMKLNTDLGSGGLMEQLRLMASFKAPVLPLILGVLYILLFLLSEVLSVSLSKKIRSVGANRNS